MISLLKEHHEIAHLNIHMPSMLALLYSSILGTAVAFVGWNWVLGNIEASIASISLMSVPILGLIFGFIQLHEAITRNVIIGAIFVCLGILFTSLPKKKPLKG
ncbi:DMT family transporter [Bacillus sp. SLBN-3]